MASLRSDKFPVTPAATMGGGMRVGLCLTILHVVAGRSGQAVFKQSSMLRSAPVRCDGVVTIVGDAGDVGGASVYAEEPLDVVVPRSEVCVRDRPVRPGAIKAGSVELLVTDPERVATPEVQAAAHLPAAIPVEPSAARGRVGIFAIVHEQVSGEAAK